MKFILDNPPSVTDGSYGPYKDITFIPKPQSGGALVPQTPHNLFVKCLQVPHLLHHFNLHRLFGILPLLQPLVHLLVQLNLNYFEIKWKKIRNKMILYMIDALIRLFLIS